MHEESGDHGSAVLAELEAQEEQGGGHVEHPGDHSGGRCAAAREPSNLRKTVLSSTTQQNSKAKVIEQ